MMFIFLLCIHSEIAFSFRGPHHPRSSISHHHYSPQSEIKLTQDDELLHDTLHLTEDLGPLAEQLDITHMAEQEIDFHYFKLHDMDNNTKLDGLEILNAIQHTLHDHSYESFSNETSDAEDKELIENKLPWIVGLIDKVLEEDDLDNDGYLAYIEFVLGRQKGQRDSIKSGWRRQHL
ncbi:multiple coagulation factor deficiency protein 2 homolog isoform X2 [Nasonia vitripennis]|nr:multiple coagulation factor deficiency protein 2 homolog isoform X2 [Nasonia vitripennis]